MSQPTTYPKVSSLAGAAALVQRWQELGWLIPCDAEVLTAEAGSPLASSIEVFGRKVGNRWCIQPMEGWDGTADGRPSEWTRRRWEHFGRSGAKLIWGGEAVAVRHEGRANPNQLLISPQTQADLANLRAALAAAHHEATGRTDDLVVGLQLTHSGRFCRPNSQKLEPRIAYHHPILDKRFGIASDDASVVISDDELYRLMDDFVDAARLVAEAGFDFVDLKACHGYLGHELLGGFTRAGIFGGSFENRTRFLRELVARVRETVPRLHIGVRVSAFDIVPFEDDPATRVGRHKGVGIPSAHAHLQPYCYGFGVNQDEPQSYDLTEAFLLLEALQAWGVQAVNITGGSPYYNPHIQRPAYYPPSDGYLPPEDPLEGVARHLSVVRELKTRFPEMVFVGSAYTYLQEFLPTVGQAMVRDGWVDFVGIGRMVLSYPELPIDCLTRGILDTRRLCRTFSDCTTGPRKGLISGCYPLDEAYKRSEAGQQLREIKRTGD